MTSHPVALLRRIAVVLAVGATACCHGAPSNKAEASPTASSHAPLAYAMHVISFPSGWSLPEFSQLGTRPGYAAMGQNGTVAVILAQWSGTYADPGRCPQRNPRRATVQADSIPGGARFDRTPEWNDNVLVCVCCPPGTTSLVWPRSCGMCARRAAVPVFHGGCACWGRDAVRHLERSHRSWSVLRNAKNSARMERFLARRTKGLGVRSRRRFGYSDQRVDRSRGVRPRLCL